MKSAVQRKMNRRLGIVVAGFMLIFCGLATMAVYLQVLRGPWLSSVAKKRYLRSIVVRPQRGRILDANGEEMALTLDGYAVGAHPHDIKNVELVARKLAKTLALDSDALSRRLHQNKKFVWVKHQVAPDRAQAVRGLNQKGVVVKPEPIRSYPNRNLASQVVGFVGVDEQGLEGVEFYYNTYLAGRTDRSTIFIDAKGRRFGEDKPRELQPSGQCVVLTIDKKIQYFTENALEEAVTAYGAKSGIAVVMKPPTGAILAIAHYPFFNPNRVEGVSQEIRRNRALTDPFEPGSTLKIFTAAAALEARAGSANTIFFCENGKYRLGRNTIHDTHPHGWLSLQQIVKFSSNIGAVKLLEAMRPKPLYQTLRRFGFGEKTGIDLPGETTGRLRPHRLWRRIDAANIAFGQGISVSAIQLVTATAAIANGGLMMKPHVVKALTDAEGNIVKNFEPKVVRRAVSAETARTMKRILATVITEGGTGVRAALEGYAVAGKTGTAQKIGPDGRYSRKKFVSSFVGFAPLKNPQVAILVVVDEPRKRYYGGTVAAPGFRKIALKTLNYLNVAPGSGSTKAAGGISAGGAGA